MNEVIHLLLVLPVIIGGFQKYWATISQKDTLSIKYPMKTCRNTRQHG
jgi:hypothetical protein